MGLVSNYAWAQVGEVLRRARALKAPGKSRVEFAKAVGASRSLRVLNDIETGKRENYDPQTIANVEVWYELRPGQIHEVVAAAKQLEQAERVSSEVRARLQMLRNGTGDRNIDLAELENAVAEAADRVKRRRRTLFQAQEVVPKSTEPTNARTGGSDVTPASEDASHVLLDLPDEALEGLDELQREEVKAAARLAALKTARELRGR